jgi:hypothetical protein
MLGLVGGSSLSVCQLFRWFVLFWQGPQVILNGDIIIGIEEEGAVGSGIRNGNGVNQSGDDGESRFSFRANLRSFRPILHHLMNERK